MLVQCKNKLYKTSGNTRACAYAPWVGLYPWLRLGAIYLVTCWTKVKVKYMYLFICYGKDVGRMYIFLACMNICFGKHVFLIVFYFAYKYVSLCVYFSCKY